MSRRRVQMSLLDAFQQGQKNAAHHEACVAACLQIYHQQCEKPDGLGEFQASFFDLFNRCLVIFKREPAVERIIEFAVKFVAASTQTDGELLLEEDEFTFMNAFIKHLVSISGAKDKAVRFRACQTLSKLLHALDEEAEIDDDIWEDLQTAMLERIKDKIPVVRVQAINALSRLQDPSDIDCPVIAEYQQRLTCDASPDVRKAALVQIALSKATITDVASRSRDVKDVVRKALYTVLKDKLDLRALSIQQRLDLVRDGLNDRCVDVREACSKLIVSGWYEQLNKEPSQLFDVLDVETDEETCELAAAVLLETVGQWQNVNVTQFKQLTASSAFWWRCLCEFLQKSQDHADILENVLPLPSDLAMRIDDLTQQVVQSIEAMTEEQLENSFANTSTDSWTEREANMQAKAFVLCQLLKLAKLVDYSDEAGRRAMAARLRSMCMKHWQQLPEDVLTNCLELLSKLHPSATDRIHLFTEIVHDMRDDLNSEDNTRASEREEEDEDRDEDDILSCSMACILAKLKVMSFALERMTMSPRNTCMSGLIDTLVLPSIQNGHAEIRNMAVRCLGLCCIADKSLAQTHLLLLLQVAQVDQEVLQLTALRILFDLVLAYGVSGIMSPAASTQLAVNDLQDEDVERPSETNQQATIIPVMMRYLDSDDDNLRCAAVEGFAKLLLHNHICSAQVFSHLVILFFNPLTTEDVTLRQCLSVFFPAYGFSSRSHQDVIEEAFLPTIRTLAMAPRSSPLYSVKLQDVVDLFIYLTGKMDVSDQNPAVSVKVSDLGVHHNVALTMANEILSDPQGVLAKPLCKALSSLDLSTFDDATRQDLFVLAENMLSEVEDRYSKAYILKMMEELQVDGQAISTEARESLAEKQLAHKAGRAEELGVAPSNEPTGKNKKTSNPKKAPRASRPVRSKKATTPPKDSENEDDDEWEENDNDASKSRRTKQRNQPAATSRRQPRRAAAKSTVVEETDESDEDDAHVSQEKENNIDDLLSASEGEVEQVYEIERLLKVKLKGKGRVFLVRWKGFDSSDDSWEPEANLPATLVEEFDNKENLPSRKSSKSMPSTKKKAASTSRQQAEIDVLLMSDEDV
eukprot:m.130069 g.130069  ORF g.130069 m.130069 type:complete len:1089 (+) comp15712_c0_seq3:239-3505(+)